jgi:enamine deaminase RidA (YjgF/YER057c/UK114 family)
MGIVRFALKYPYTFYVLAAFIVFLGVSVTTSGDIRDQPKVADAASELLRDVFGKDKSPCRLVYGVASLPLGTPVELEVIFEVAT